MNLPSIISWSQLTWAPKIAKVCCILFMPITYQTITLGFPPSNNKVHDFLTMVESSSKDPFEASMSWACHFLKALFYTTMNTINGLESRGCISTGDSTHQRETTIKLFRSFMLDGQGSICQGNRDLGSTRMWLIMQRMYVISLWCPFWVLPKLITYFIEQGPRPAGVAQGIQLASNLSYPKFFKKKAISCQCIHFVWWSPFVNKPLHKNQPAQPFFHTSVGT